VVQLNVRLNVLLEEFRMALPRVVPISDLRADAAALVKQTRETREPVIITQRGRAAAVLMSVEDYNRNIDRFKMLESLTRAQSEIRAGARGHSLEEVMAMTDAIIKKYE
jgi:prevent-host-death family protein